MVTQETNKWVYTPPVKPVTPKDIYGTDTPEIPKGYEIVDFRAPRVGDVVRCTWGGTDTVLLGENWPEPRFILAKLPEQPATAPDGYEFTGEYRQVNESLDTWLGLDLKAHGTEQCGKVDWECGDEPNGARRWILRPVPTPTLKSIYGTNTPVIPEGWESTGAVRLPKKYEYYLSIFGLCYESEGALGLPRLILRKKAEPVKSEAKFKVGDWVKGQIRDEEPCVGQVTGIDYLGFIRVDNYFSYHASELTPVAAPPAGFKYTKV